ncbi:MAG: FtsQ-type POTRA domain-containing protein [Clostridia bacterium]|nr:FtsQ-type POTRA domain-containing protein [Clostridia bacterium]
MNENEYRPPSSQDEDLSPAFTRNRPRPVRRVPSETQGQKSAAQESKKPDAVPNTPTAVRRPTRAESTPPPASGREAQAPLARTAVQRPVAAPKASTGAYVPEETERKENKPSAAGRSPDISRKIKRIVWLVLIAALLFVGVCIVSNTFLSVKEINVLGAENAMGWSEEEILQACGITIGDPMYRVDAKEVSARISSAFSALSGAEVVKEFPGKITILPISATPSYRFSFEDKTYVLSSELKVLTELTDAYAELPELVLSSVGECKIGDILSFAGEYDYEIILETTRELSELLADFEVNRVDLSNKFSIAVICESKYKLLFGDREALAQKVYLAKKTLEDPQFRYNATAEIDVSSANKAVVKFTQIGN